MALELPKSRRSLQPIQITKRNIPLEQIIAVQGQNPLATGIETAGNAVSQALQKRNQMRQQGQQIAELAALTDQQVPDTTTGLSPDQYVSAIKAKSELEKNSLERATTLAGLKDKSKLNYTPEQTDAILSGDAKRLATAFGGVIPKEAVGQSISGMASGGRNDYYSTRGSATFLNELPSNSSPSTAAGAAYGVKVAARQGKDLIAKAGSPQALALASSDLARAVQRSAPQLDAMRGGDFTNNLVTKLNAFSQRFTADPQGTIADVPKVRKEIFDILDGLDKSAQPFIEQKLQNIEDTFPEQLPKNWGSIKNREMGVTIKPIPFEGASGLQPLPGVGTGRSGGVTHRWNPATGRVEEVTQ